MAEWILKEELASEKLRVPIYFRRMTAIGPMSTDDVAEAARFGSKQEAMQCPAYIHPLCCYEPEQLEGAIKQ